jgi:hypothetical protein
MTTARSMVLSRGLAAVVLCLVAWPAAGLVGTSAGGGDHVVSNAPTASARPHHDRSLRRLGAEWWQWVLSIPTAVNPLLDDTGTDCMVGQRGSTWFLVGNFGGGTSKRSCSVPEGTRLAFPVINSVNVDTPNVCGQGPRRIPVAELRALSAAFVDAAVVSATLDGKRLHDLRRIRSVVFPIALPEENCSTRRAQQLAACPPASTRRPSTTASTAWSGR